MHRRREAPAQPPGPKRLLTTALLGISLSAALLTSACGTDATATDRAVSRLHSRLTDAGISASVGQLSFEHMRIDSMLPHRQGTHRAHRPGTGRQARRCHDAFWRPGTAI